VSSSSSAETLSKTDIERGRANLTKAWKEHYPRKEVPASLFASVAQTLEIDQRTIERHGRVVLNLGNITPQRCAAMAAHNPKIGTIWAIFNGRDGKLSAWAAENLLGVLETVHEEWGDHPVQLFEQVMIALQEGIKKLDDTWGGTSALICFLPIKTSNIWTATLGDSEAFLVRKGVLIPLTCVRTWFSKHDWERAKKAGFKWEKSHFHRAKDVHFPDSNPHYRPDNWGVTLPRSLGDLKYREEAISLKPRVTLFEGVQPGDQLVMLSQGALDNLPQTGLLSLVKEGDKTAQGIIDACLKVMIWAKEANNLGVIHQEFV
jgi:serine/threonine protein phosphatase PrpC